MPTWCYNVLCWSFFSSTCFGRIRSSSGALDFKLQHMVLCTEFLDGWWSWEPLCRSCVRCGWCSAVHRYISNWLRYVTRMNNSWMPKIVVNYRPNGGRRLGRPLKRLLDVAETGLTRPNSWRMMIMIILKDWAYLWEPQALCTVAWNSAVLSYTDVPTTTPPPPPPPPPTPTSPLKK